MPRIDAQWPNVIPRQVLPPQVAQPINFAGYPDAPKYTLFRDPEPPAYTAGPGGPEGLNCTGWRKTTKCDASGPRDPLNDKDCNAVIPPDEPGFCECEGNVHTMSVPCDHKPFKCQDECARVVKIVGEVFGAKYKPPPKLDKPDTSDPATSVDPSVRAQHFGEKAVSSVNDAVNAANQAVTAARDMMARMLALEPWRQIKVAGIKAEEAGLKAQEMAKMARPFIYSQVDAKAARVG